MAAAILENDVKTAPGRGSGLADKPIQYIPNESFEAATEQDFAEIDCQLYIDEDDSPVGQAANSPAEAFLLAVDHSRVLTVEGERFLFKRLNFLRFRAGALQATLTGSRREKKTVKEIERLLQEADTTRQHIAHCNLRLVTSIVRKLASSHDEFDEFFSEANAILLNAIDKFDYARGYRFSTYATHAVQRHVYRLIQRARRRRVVEGTGAEGIESFADVDGLSETNASQLEAAMNSVLASLDKVLDDREQQIVRLRFGLDGSNQGRSMRIIGDELGLSKERVRQILNSSLEKLGQANQSLASVLDES